MITYSDKVKFILDYVIFFGKFDKEQTKYHYEFSKDEIVDVYYEEELVKFFMYNDELAAINWTASNFDITQESVLDVFYENIILRLGESSVIPTEMSETIREASLDAHKEWNGLMIIREKDKGTGVKYKIHQIPTTGTVFFLITGYVTKSLYFLRFSTGEFYDLSDPVYERLYNR